MNYLLNTIFAVTCEVRIKKNTESKTSEGGEGGVSATLNSLKHYEVFYIVILTKVILFLVHSFRQMFNGCIQITVGKF